MAKENQKEEGLVGLGERLSSEHLSTGKSRGKTRLIMLGIVLLLGAGGYFFIANSSSTNKFELVKVTKRDLRELVEITGNVEAGATINLTFRASGQLEKINNKVGDALKNSDVIANLKNKDQELQLSQAKANLVGAQANLNQKLAGSTSENILIAETQVTKAEASADKVATTWDNAKIEVDLMKKKYFQDEKRAQLAVDDAKNKYEYALKNQGNAGKTSDQAVLAAQKDLETQLYSTAAQLQQSLLDLKSIIINDGNSLLGQDYNRLGFDVINPAADLYGNVNRAFSPFYEKLKTTSTHSVEQISDFGRSELDWANQLLQSQKIVLDGMSKLVSSVTLPSTTIENLKNKLLADNSSLSLSLSSLNLKYQALENAKLSLTTNSDTQDSSVSSAKLVYEQQVQALAQNKIDHQVDLNSRESNIRDLEAQYKIAMADIDSAKANLKQIKAGPRAVDLAFLKAQVVASQISVDLAEEALEKTLLRAPIDGVLSRSNIDVGEDVTSSSSIAVSGTAPAFEMISSQKFKINAQIAEVDINKLKVGNPVEITLDAVGSDTVFPGTITRIDPVQTVVQDVVFYKAEIVVGSVDSRIKPGMTATVDIVLKEAKDALTVPEKSIQTDNGKTSVRIPDATGKNMTNVPIEIGVRDLQGNVEVKSGLTEGQSIILKANGK